MSKSEMDAIAVSAACGATRQINSYALTNVRTARNADKLSGSSSSQFGNVDMSLGVMDFTN